MKGKVFEPDRIVVRRLYYSDIPTITRWWNNGAVKKGTPIWGTGFRK
ncbi:MAG: hypothetical protein GX994_05100 [Firmicutes bacterium]|nr:hypothetical protein [Bacillota bacterium]